MDERTHATGYRMVRTPEGAEVELMTEIESIVSDSRLDRTIGFGRLPAGHPRRRVVVVVENETQQERGRARFDDSRRLVVSEGVILSVSEIDQAFAHQVRSSYFWHRAPRWAQWAAVDRSGAAFWFQHKPEPVSQNGIWSAGFGHCLRIPLCDVKVWIRSVDWRDTLCDRQEGDPR